jgi:hypothetical protein
MDTSAAIEDLKKILNQSRESIKRVVSSERDRRTIWFAGIGGLVILLYLIFQFFSSGSARLEKKIQSLQGDLKKIEVLKAEYLQSKRSIEELIGKIKTGDEPLISMMEKILVESQVDRGNFSIKSKNPTPGDLYEETSVDVELKKISLGKMVDLLYKVQTMPVFLKVSKFRPQVRFDNPDFLDASFRVSTFKLNKVL